MRAGARGGRVGHEAGPLTACSQSFLPSPNDAATPCKLLQGNQGHDPSFNLASNWGGQMYPRDLMSGSISQIACKC